MAETLAVRQQALTACFSCRTKKRKCDRRMPACSRCVRGQQHCQYDFPVYRMEHGLSESDEGGDSQHRPGYPYQSTNSRKSCKRCRAGKRFCSREYPSCARCTRIGVSCFYTLPTSLYWPQTLTSSVSTPATPTHHDLNDSDYSQLSPSSVVDLDPSTHCRDSLFPPHLQRETPKPPAPADRLPPTSFQETHMNTSLVENWIHSAHISPPSFPTSLTSDQEHPRPANEPTHPPSTTEDYETLLIERNAILSLKEFLHTCRPEDATDQIILDAFVLAWPPDTSSGTALPTSHLQGPMPLQRVEVMEAHIHGLRYLVEARGGLDKLEMRGLAEGLSTFDLVTASRNLAKPHWPVKTSLDPNEITRFLDRFSPVLDTGSDHLFAAVQASFNPAAALVFDTLRRYIVLLQEYAQGHLEGLDMAYLLGSRNIIHHRALSLPATHDPPRRRVNEPFRLAVTAFSLLVVFPTPLMARPYHRLAESLRGELGSVEECYQDWIGMPEVLVWVLVLGGIAATGTPQRAWYAGKLRWLVAMLGIVSWEQMRRILKSVVWMENLCVDEGVALWQEIQAC